MHTKNVDNKVFKTSLINIVGIPSVFFVIAVFMIHYQSKILMEIYYESEKIVETKLSVSEYFRLHVDMETSLRGYIITGDKVYLEPLYKAEGLKNEYKEVIFERLSGQDYDVSKKYRELVRASERWYDAVAVKVLEPEPDFVITDRFRKSGRLKFNKIRVALEDINQLLDQKSALLKARTETINDYTLFLKLLIVFMFVVFLYILLKKQVSILVSSYRNLINRNEMQLLKTEEAARAKDLFLANMSHEIRTPLGAILGFVELALEDSTVKPETKGHLLFVKRNGAHLLGLVEDLFDLSKVGSNKLEVFNERTDLLEIVKDIKNIFASQCENSNIRLDLIIKNKICRYVHTDPVRLKQILTNLVGNAIKFSKPGNPVKLIITSHEDKVIFDVIDQGLGIPKDKQDLIFTAFEQVDVNHSRKYGGAGLGLSISKNLSKLMNGTLQLVESKVNVGSHFRASFLLKSLDEAFFTQESIQMENAHEVDQKQNFSFVNLKGKKILLAEDSRENQILFKIFLESEGLNVEVVESGTEAVRAALNSKHDLILMDIQMPGLDGYEATKILKESGYDRKIIALTAHAIAGEKEKCLKMGFDGYLSKPVTKILLLSTISEFIS